MFFNMETGETSSTGQGFECWMADGNLWIAGYGMETSINQIPVEPFCLFLEKSTHTDEYMDIELPDQLNISLEPTDENTRNLCFFAGRLFIDINMRIEYLPKLAAFIRDNK